MHTTTFVAIHVEYTVNMITRRTYVLTAILIIATAALWLFMFINGYVSLPNAANWPNIAPLHHRTGKIVDVDPASQTITLESGEIFTLYENATIYTVIPRELPGLASRSIRKEVRPDEIKKEMIVTVSYRSLDADVLTDALDIYVSATAGTVPLYPSLFEGSAVAGTVKEVDVDGVRITIAIDTVDHVFSITPDTVIHRALLFEEDGIQRKIHEELNVADVSVGDPVMVYPTTPFKAGETSPELYEIYLGSFTYDDEFIASSLAVRAGNPSAPAVVEDIDLEDGILTYRTIVLPSSTTTSAVLMMRLEDVAIYSVEDQARAQILHVRTPLSVDEIRPGDTIAVISKVIMLSTEPPRGGYHPFELVVIRPR